MYLFLSFKGSISTFLHNFFHAFLVYGYVGKIAGTLVSSVFQFYNRNKNVIWRKLWLLRRPAAHPPFCLTAAATLLFSLQKATGSVPSSTGRMGIRCTPWTTAIPRVPSPPRTSAGTSSALRPITIAKGMWGSPWGSFRWRRQGRWGRRPIPPPSCWWDVVHATELSGSAGRPPVHSDDPGGAQPIAGRGVPKQGAKVTSALCARMWCPVRKVLLPCAHRDERKKNEKKRKKTLIPY